MTAMLLLVALSLGADSEVSLKEVQITLPETIGALKFKERQDYKKYGPGLGYSVAYANRMSKVSIYVYDRELKDIPDGKEGKLVEQELKTAADDLKHAEKKGVYTNVKPMEGDLKLPKTVLDKFAAAGYTYDITGGGCKGYVLAAGYRGKIIKFRTTQYVVDGKTNDDEFHAFLEVVVKHFQPSEE
jgi:hypothetical protein